MQSHKCNKVTAQARSSTQHWFILLDSKLVDYDSLNVYRYYMIPSYNILHEYFQVLLHQTALLLAFHYWYISYISTSPAIPAQQDEQRSDSAGPRCLGSSILQWYQPSLGSLAALAPATLVHLRSAPTSSGKRAFASTKMARPSGQCHRRAQAGYSGRHWEEKIAVAHHANEPQKDSW